MSEVPRAVDFEGLIAGLLTATNGVNPNSKEELEQAITPLIQGLSEQKSALLGNKLQARMWRWEGETGEKNPYVTLVYGFWPPVGGA